MSQPGADQGNREMRTPYMPKTQDEQRAEIPKASWSPQPKVAAAATTVPFSGLVLWGVEQFGVDIPLYVAGDVAILLAVLVAYLVPEK